MKKFNILSSLLLAFALMVGVSATTVKAQSPDAVFDQIAAALGKGDATALSSHLSTSVEVTAPGADQTYSAQQATFVLKDFFTKNPVKGFSITHKGSSGATWYATGTYLSSTGSYDTNIFVKKTAEKYQITQIRFEAE